jgi:serine protease Do
MTKILAALLSFLLFVASSSLASDRESTSLEQFSRSVESLTTRVAKSVVQIVATGYGPIEDDGDPDDAGVVGPTRALGSGVVVGADGYIMTNAHVVTEARRVDVVLPADTDAATPLQSLSAVRGRSVAAEIVGVDQVLDLALLKIDAGQLPALPFADYDRLRQGQVVFAIGNPEGLSNSVSMGVVSAVARQFDADSPVVYVQTDAAINRGNSGGPLVDATGSLVGLNTFILTASGGSQGLGFAIPSAYVKLAYDELKQHGRLFRAEIGLHLQAITPALAAGLHLSRACGVVISDVAPDGPAARAGLKAQDVVLTVDGRAAENVPSLALRLLKKEPGSQLLVSVLRSDATIESAVPISERAVPIERSSDPRDPSDPAGGSVPALGIIGIGLSPAEGGSPFRIESGVIVAARAQTASHVRNGLVAGDVIHAVDSVPVLTAAALRDALSEEARRSAVLQVERSGVLMYMTVDLD